MNEHYPTPGPEVSEIITELHQPRPTVIALEGGPCGGKTTVVNQLVLAADEQARPVVVLPEAATEYIAKLQAAGLSIPDLAVHDRPGFLAFEADVLGTIVHNIETAREQWKGTDALIVTDRSDIGAYVSSDEYAEILHMLGREQPPHLDLVDKLIYLPSLAREDASKYESLLETNTSRYETAQEAIDTCTRTLGAVAIHPELAVYWGGDFPQKVERVTDEVFHPEREVESKFTADKSMTREELAGILGRITTLQLSETAITQSYHVADGQDFRLRHSQLQTGQSVYHYAVKTGSGSIRQELNRILTPEQYAALRQTSCYGELTKIRSRHLFELQGDRTGEQAVLSADFYTDRDLSVIELEGLTDDQAKAYTIPGFTQGGVSARELVQ